MNELDRYRLTHTAFHLYEDARFDALHHLLTLNDRWLREKAAFFAGDSAFSADIDLALTLAKRTPLGTPEPLVELYTLRQLIQIRTELYTNVDLTTLALLGKVEDALNRARLRPTLAEKVDSFLEIYAVVAGNTAYATRCYQELETSFGFLTEPVQRGIALTKLVTIEVQHKAPAVIQVLLAQINDIAMTVPATEEAREFLGLYGMALALLGDIHTVITTILPQLVEYWACEVLIALATYHVDADEPAMARTYFLQAWQLSGDITDEFARAGTRADIARAYAKSGADATEWFQVMIADALEVESPFVRASMLSLCASAMAEAHAIADAWELLTRYVPGWIRDAALVNLVSVFARQSEFTRAMAVMEQMTDNHKRGEAGRIIAQQWARSGNPQRASELLAIAHQATQHHQDRHAVTATMHSLAQTAIVFWVQGKTQIAATLFERAQNLIDVGVDPVDHERLKRVERWLENQVATGATESALKWIETQETSRDHYIGAVILALIAHQNIDLAQALLPRLRFPADRTTAYSYFAIHYAREHQWQLATDMLRIAEANDHQSDETRLWFAELVQSGAIPPVAEPAQIVNHARDDLLLAQGIVAHLAGDHRRFKSVLGMVEQAIKERAPHQRADSYLRVRACLLMEAEQYQAAQDSLHAIQTRDEFLQALKYCTRILLQRDLVYVALALLDACTPTEFIVVVGWWNQWALQHPGTMPILTDVLTGVLRLMAWELPEWQEYRKSMSLLSQ